MAMCSLLSQTTASQCFDFGCLKKSNVYAAFPLLVMITTKQYTGLEHLTAKSLQTHSEWQTVKLQKDALLNMYTQLYGQQPTVPNYDVQQCDFWRLLIMIYIYIYVMICCNNHTNTNNINNNNNIKQNKNTDFRRTIYQEGLPGPSQSLKDPLNCKTEKWHNWYECIS